MLCALKAAEERPVARPRWTEVLGWPMHTPLALDHSAELEWKFVNSSLACWISPPGWPCSLFFPLPLGLARCCGEVGAGSCRALLSDALISTFCQLYQWKSRKRHKDIPALRAMA